MAQEFDQVSLGEVFRRVVEDGKRNQEALLDIRNNMVSKGEYNAQMNAQNARIASIEANLAQKQADASHEHAELEAHSAARNQEVKNLLEKEQAERKLAFDKEQSERKAAVAEQAEKFVKLEEGNKSRNAKWLFAIALAGIGVVLNLLQGVIGRGLGL